MKTISFFDTKPYDKEYFEEIIQEYPYEIIFHEEKLNARTAILAQESEAVAAVINVTVDQIPIDQIICQGASLILL